MQPVPTLKSVMTPFPHSVEVNADIRTARAMMDQHGIRHLPVTENHKLIGLLSERDIWVARNVSDETLAELSITAGSVCSRNPYVAEITDPLADVVLDMATRQVDSAVIVRHDRLAGILTTTDVCRLLGELLKGLMPGQDIPA